MSDSTDLFHDEELRNDWLTCLKFLRDSEVPTMTYRGWLEAELWTTFDVLEEEGLDYVSTYVLNVRRIFKELMFLNRNEL